MAKLITELSYDFELAEDKKANEMYAVGIFSSAELLNNNKRRYRKEILEREVDKIDKKVQEKCLWGELGHPPCLYGDTEILTSEGWKEIRNIKENEIIATLNPKSKEIEYHEIKKKVVNSFDGKMIRFKNRQIDMAFTPDHRFILYDKYNTPGLYAAKDIIQKETLKFDKSYVPKTGILNNEGRDYFIIKGTEKKNYRYFNVYSEDLKIDSKIFSALLGLYLAEGCVQKKGIVNIYQKKEESRIQIRNLFSVLSEMGFKTKEHDGRFTITDPRLGTYLKKLGNCYNKYIPKEVFNFSKECKEELLYWFCIGDGRHYYKDGYEKRDIFSTSEKLIDDFHRLAFECGISCRKTVKTYDTEYKFKDRIIKPENKQPLYFLKILSSNGIYLDRRFMEISQEEYHGNVYCVQVQNQNFYIRNENSVSFFTGNCPEINPDKIAIRTMKLEWKGNDLYGKAKILDTPMGSIAKTLVKEGKMGISSRGLGTVSDDGYVNEDFNLITWDLVTDPSNNPSWVNGIYEGCEFELKNSSGTRTKEPTKEEIKEAQEYYANEILNILDEIDVNVQVSELFGMGKKVIADPEKLMKSIYTSLRSAYNSKDPETFFTVLNDMVKNRKSFMNAIKQYKKMTGRDVIGSTSSSAKLTKRPYKKRS